MSDQFDAVPKIKHVVTRYYETKLMEKHTITMAALPIYLKTNLFFERKKGTSGTIWPSL